MTEKKYFLRVFFGGGGWLKKKLFFSIEKTISEATNDMHIWSMYVSDDVSLSFGGKALIDLGVEYTKILWTEIAHKLL